MVVGNFSATPHEVQEWYNQNLSENDVGMLLDYPPYAKVEDQSSNNRQTWIKVGDEEFIECLRRTKKSAEAMVKSRRVKHLFYGIVHGDTFTRMERWYGEMKDLAVWDGWAYAPKATATNPIALVKALIFAHAHTRELPFHIFGITGNSTLPVMVYAMKDFPGHMTVDSTTYLQGAASRHYMLMTGVRHNIRLTSEEVGRIELEELPCDCPICIGHTPDDLIGIGRPENDPIPGNLISMHNLVTMVKHIQILQCLRRDPESFAIYSGFVKTRQALDIWDYYIEHGYEAVKKRETVLGAAFVKGQRTLGEEYGTVDTPAAEMGLFD